MAYLVFDSNMIPFNDCVYFSDDDATAVVFDSFEEAQVAVKEWAMGDCGDDRVLKFYEVTPTSAHLVGSYRVECIVKLKECEG